MFSLILDTITIQKLLKYARKKCGERVFLEFIINNFTSMIVEFIYKYIENWVNLEKKIKTRTLNIVHIWDERFITWCWAKVHKDDIISIENCEF